MRPRLSRTLIGLSAAIFSSAASLSADPYCPALTDPNEIGAVYHRLAPIYSSAESGWIFADDQLRQSYAMKEDATHLLQEVVAELRSRGVDIAVLVAPPRPLIAGTAARDATVPRSARYDPWQATTSFQQMIRQIQQAGAIAPDLLSALMAEPARAPGYYFKRDTHWTPEGAAFSAQALAHALAARGVAGLALPGARATPSETETYSETGSLSKVVSEVCSVRPPPEEVRAMHFPDTNGALGLLSDDPAPKDRAALLGTSYSDRNQRDVYRVADALAHATGLNVDNLSVSGGGAATAFETFILSGLLDTGGYGLVIWEVPYTSAFKSVSELRQILGALHATRAIADVRHGALPEAGQARIMLPGETHTIVGIQPPSSGRPNIQGTVYFDDGARTRVTFKRSDRAPKSARDAPIYLSLADNRRRRAVALDLTYDGAVMAGSVVTVAAVH